LNQKRFFDGFCHFNFFLERILGHSENTAIELVQIKLFHSFHGMLILNVLNKSNSGLVLRILHGDPALSVLSEKFNDILSLGLWGYANNLEGCGLLGLRVCKCDFGVLHHKVIVCINLVRGKLNLLNSTD